MDDNHQWGVVDNLPSDTEGVRNPFTLYCSVTAFLTYRLSERDRRDTVP